MTALRNASSKIRRELPKNWSRHLAQSRPLATAACRQTAPATTGTATVNQENSTLQQTQTEIEPTKPTSVSLDELFGDMPPLAYPDSFKVECLSDPEAMNKRIAELVWYDKTLVNLMRGY